MSNDADDARLADRARAGDTPALATLLQRYRDPLVALAYQLTRNRDDALDLVQDASLRAFERVAELADPALFYGWMRGIVRHLSFDKHRARSRRDAHLPEIARHHEEARALATDKAEAVTREVIEAILSLPEEYHVPLFCRYVEEAAYTDIALRAGRSLDSVRGLIYRGTQLLRKKLAHHLER